MPRVPDNRTQGYFVRKPIHLLKVATLVSLSRRDDLKYRMEDLIASLALLDSIEPGMKRAFSAVGTNPYATDIERIEMQIRRSGGMLLSDIVTSNFHNLDDIKLQGALSSLVAMRKIEKKMSGSELVYIPVKAGGDED